MNTDIVRLGLKSRIFLILSFAVSLNISAGGLSVFRSEAPDPFRVEVKPKSKSSFERLIEDTTTALIEPIKTVAQSLLPEGKLSDFLEFLLGYGSTQETAQKESEQLEAKVEAGYKLNSKEALKLELLRNEVSISKDQPDAYGPPEGLLVVFAPGQELLKNLPEAIKQMAQENNLSEEDIRSELEEIWNPKNYKNPERIKKLRNVVAGLFGRVLDLRHEKKSALEKNETYGHKIESSLAKSGMMPSTVVLGIVFLDEVLINCQETHRLEDEFITRAITGSFHVSGVLLCDRCEISASSKAEFSKCVWYVTNVLNTPGLIRKCVSQVKHIFNARALGNSVDSCFKVSSAYQSFQMPSVMKLIGSGAYSVVFLSDCSNFAIKRIEFENIGTKEKPLCIPSEDFFRELLRPECSQILPIVSIGATKKSICLTTPCCKMGDLRKAVKKEKTQNPEVARKYLFQILQALAELEKNNIIHGDLKTQNVFLESEEKIVLADFGLSCPNLPGVPDDEVLVTLGYRPPEVLFGIGPITAAIDVFAAGVIFWEMSTLRKFSTPMAVEEPTSKDYFINQRAAMLTICGVPDKNNWPELHEKYPDILSESASWREEITDDNRDELVGLHRQFIELLPREALNLWNRMIIWNPAKRITVTEALKHEYFKNLTSQDSNPSAQTSAATSAASS